MSTVDTKITSKEKEFTLSIPVNSSRIIRVLGIIMVVLIITGIAASSFHVITGRGRVYGLVPLFELYGENSIPEYFTAFLLLIAASLLGIIAIYKIRKHASYSTHWLILSIIFLLVSIDESVSTHELLILPLRNAFHLSGFLYFSWVIVGFIFVLLFAIAYLKFFFNLAAKTRLYFAVAAFFLVGGAVGIESIGGHYIDMYHRLDLTYTLITTLEESLEMLGILIFIKALLDYIEDNVSGVFFSFKNLRSIG